MNCQPLQLYCHHITLINCTIYIIWDLERPSWIFEIKLIWYGQSWIFCKQPVHVTITWFSFLQIRYSRNSNFWKCVSCGYYLQNMCFWAKSWMFLLAINFFYMILFKLSLNYNSKIMNSIIHKYRVAELYIYTQSLVKAVALEFVYTIFPWISKQAQCPPLSSVISDLTGTLIWKIYIRINDSPLHHLQ